MDDLISRQAAIDAVRRSEALDRAFGYGHAVTALMELPSAQPEMVKCKQCRHVYYDKEFDNYWCDRMSDPFKVEADGYCKWGK